MTSNTTDSTNIIIGTGKRASNRTFTAADIIAEFRQATFGELIEEKNPGISFDLLPPEVKEKAREKLKAFDEIVKPKADQKQEDHSTNQFTSQEAEFNFWYQTVLPKLQSVIGIPSASESK